MIERCDRAPTAAAATPFRIASTNVGRHRAVGTDRLVDHIPSAALWLRGVDATANRLAVDLLGLGPDDGPAPRVRVDDRAGSSEAGVRAGSDPAAGPIVLEIRSETGPPRRFFTARVGPHPDGGAIVVLTETSEAHRLDAAVAELASGIYAADASDGGFVGTWMPDRVAVGLGLAADQFPGVDVFTLIHPDDLAAARSMIDQAKAAPGTVAWANVRITHPVQPDGYYAVLVRCIHLPGDDAIGGMLVRFDTGPVAGDDADLVRHEGSLTLRDANPVGFFNLRADGAVVQRNSRIREMLRPVTDDESGRAWLDLVRPEDRPQVDGPSPPPGPASVAVDADRPRRLRQRALDSTSRSCRHRNDRGEVNGMFVTMVDLTAEREARRSLAAAQEQLWWDARRDPLTGLANRTLLVEHLGSLFGGDRRRPADAGAGRVALLLCDLDGFKHVNDRHGHRGGDQVLVEVARRLERAVRQGDLVCRFGGDEFLVACEGLDGDDVCTLAARIIEAVGAPILVDGAVHQLGMSVGVAFERPGDVDEPDLLVTRADDAMYEAKGAGGARVATA